nr:methyltransferase domain-containing protein [Clostridium chromiireducens]
MELANGKKNKFFTLETEGENRYYIEDFNAEETKGLNNVYLLAKEVPENSVVLDVGCAQGRFGKTLKEKKCTVYGIDLDEKAIEYARNSGYYDKVFIMDVTNKDSNEYKSFTNMVNKVDAIIISDVLEHIANPTKLLLEYLKLLKEEGIILISVPNVAHLEILLNLMNDKFNYQDMGILDNTHLKFFTKTSFVDWINQINETFNDVNIDCEYLGATFYNNEFLNKIKNNYKELFMILENSSNYNGFQILFKLTKLSSGVMPLQLKKLQEESQIDVVDILGNVLEGKISNVHNHKPVEGERLWYEQQIGKFEESLQWHIDKVKELEKAIEWHHINEKTIRESLQWHIDKVKELEKAIEWHHKNERTIRESLDWYINKVEELEKAIEWHHENDKNIKELMEQKENEFQNQKNKDKQEILDLRKKLFDMENSRSWRWTKFLRKGK